MVRVAQRVRLQGSTLLFVVEHERTIYELDVVHVMRWAGSSKHDDDLIAGWYERLGLDERAQVVSGFARRRRADFEERFFMAIRRDINNLDDTTTRWRSGK